MSTTNPEIYNQPHTELVIKTQDMVVELLDTYLVEFRKVGQAAGETELHKADAALLASATTALTLALANIVAMVVDTPEQLTQNTDDLAKQIVKQATVIRLDQIIKERAHATNASQTLH